MTSLFQVGALLGSVKELNVRFGYSFYQFHLDDFGCYAPIMKMEQVSPVSTLKI